MAQEYTDLCTTPKAVFQNMQESCKDNERARRGLNIGKDSNTRKSKRHERVHSIGLDRTIQPAEIEKFFDAIVEPKYRICFQLQLFFGMRISEAIIVNLKDINLENKTIRRWNCKRRHWITMDIPPKAYEAIIAYLRIEGENIKKHDGYMIYNTRRLKPTQKKHLSDGHMRAVFRNTIKKARLDDHYVEVENFGYQPGKSRKLYRLSTHSLRHAFASAIYQKTQDIVVTSKLLDHGQLNTTLVYMDSMGKKLKEAINKTFGDEKVDEGDIEEFMKFYRMYRRLKSGDLPED